ncbi:hypothetical protein HanHA300_Chr03g0111251 [Helianthus annuus]|nr:hypothetical protein HanHA300_Chr07g0248321 [Helianthus annuus]KAJ0594687.1 hypothetical protein HanHA300_Chr03g0111251 [Helianthus annuus]KAJ0775521.1 hypothetical protein HanOQP8_Chr03g0123771 [Helianthus annuus]
MSLFVAHLLFDKMPLRTWFLMKLDLDYFSDGCCDYFLLSCWSIGR